MKKLLMLLMVSLACALCFAQNTDSAPLAFEVIFSAKGNSTDIAYTESKLNFGTSLGVKTISTVTAAQTNIASATKNSEGVAELKPGSLVSSRTVSLTPLSIDSAGLVKVEIVVESQESFGIEKVKVNSEQFTLRNTLVLKRGTAPMLIGKMIDDTEVLVSVR